MSRTINSSNKSNRFRQPVYSFLETINQLSITTLASELDKSFTTLCRSSGILYARAFSVFISSSVSSKSKILRSSEKWSLFLDWVVKLPPLCTIQRRATLQEKEKCDESLWFPNQTQTATTLLSNYLPVQTIFHSFCQSWRRRFWCSCQSAPQEIHRAGPTLEPVSLVCCFRQWRHLDDRLHCMVAGWPPAWPWQFARHSPAGWNWNWTPKCSWSAFGRASPQRHSTGLESNRSLNKLPNSKC